RTGANEYLMFGQDATAVPPRQARKLLPPWFRYAELMNPAAALRRGDCARPPPRWFCNTNQKPRVHSLHEDARARDRRPASDAHAAVDAPAREQRSDAAAADAGGDPAEPELLRDRSAVQAGRAARLGEGAHRGDAGSRPRRARAGRRQGLSRLEAAEDRSHG